MGQRNSGLAPPSGRYLPSPANPCIRRQDFPLQNDRLPQFSHCDHVVHPPFTPCETDIQRLAESQCRHSVSASGNNSSRAVKRRLETGMRDAFDRELAIFDFPPVILAIPVMASVSEVVLQIRSECEKRNGRFTQVTEVFNCCRERVCPPIIGGIVPHKSSGPTSQNVLDINARFRKP